MAEKDTTKDVEVKATPDAGAAGTEGTEKPRNLLKIAEVRMVLYVIPVALAIWLFAYIYEHYLK